VTGLVLIFFFKYTVLIKASIVPRVSILGSLSAFMNLSFNYLYTFLIDGGINTSSSSVAGADESFKMT
jgi:hypothetical protein